MPLTLAKLRQAHTLLRQAARRAVVPLDGTHYSPTGPSPSSRPSDVPRDAWQPIARGAAWGARLHTVWLRQPLQLPPELHNERVWLHLDWRADATQWSPDVIEAQVFIDDVPLAGLDAEHRLALLPPEMHSATIFLRAHVNQSQPFGGLQLVVLHEPTEQLAYTFGVVLNTLDQLNSYEIAYDQLLARLNHAYQVLDLREGSAAPRFRESVERACAYLDQYLLENLDGGTRPQIVATGHAHIDVAWLWPLWRTRQKTVHTFSTVLRLMEQYPEFHFTASTPQLYQWVKEDAPELFEQIKQRVREGRWEPIGGMWVEADCNIPNGESLVRQFVYGMRFFADEFGTRDRVLWLPDVFGYSAALPQIMRGVGIDTFMTTKISWSQFNRMPADTFRWRGIDGSDVLTHFVTTTEPHTTNKYYTYNGLLTPADVAGAWREYRQQAINDELLYLAGYGDGGGGPTTTMLETARRLSDMPGMPQTRWGSPTAYFERLHARVDDHPKLPVWVGELYLEYHRGTYTSQAWIKQANRRAEQLYHDAEWLDAWATAIVPGYQGQRETLNEGWQLILLNQFHDILPGSSIREVYNDAQQQFKEIVRIGEQVRDTALAALVPNEAQIVAVNTLGWERSDPLVVGEELAALVANDLVTQPITNLDGAAGVLVTGVRVPAYGITPVHGEPIAPPPLTITPTLLENRFFRLELDGSGEITSIRDKRIDREVIAPGKRANQLTAFEDRPLAYDAWDIDLFYEEKPYPVREAESIAVAETGPIRGGVELTRRWGSSTITQRILIYSTLPRIDFQTTIDWREHQMLLKAAFPLNINAARATHEIQFGAVERPTHRNTSWDMARFETCAQRWVDLSEGNYGVALLNDNKYGYDVHDHVLRLTLLKGGVYPDPQADQGVHHCTYALLPHGGDWRAGEVVRRAAELNAPILGARGVGRGVRKTTAASFVQCDAEHVIIDTIKTAENGDGLIVRLYEAHNGRGTAALTFATPVERAETCNLLEERIDTIVPQNNTVSVAIKPFEIVTLRVWLQR